MYRNYAFLYSKLFLDNGGIFVCKTRHLQLAGGNRDSVSGIRLCFSLVILFPLSIVRVDFNCAFQSHTITLDSGFMSPRISSPMHPGGGGMGGGMGGARGRGRGGGTPRRDREIIGKTIKITRGPYKGNDCSGSNFGAKISVAAFSCSFVHCVTFVAHSQSVRSVIYSCIQC